MWHLSPTTNRRTIVIRPVWRFTIRATVVVMMLGVLPGCWSITRSPLLLRECWSDPEQLAERSRSFKGVTESQALEAAERLLRLTWAEDAQIVRYPHKLSADIRRKRTFYLFLVAYHGIADESWAISTRSETGSTSVCVQVQGQYIPDTFVLGAEPVTNVIYPASAIERPRGSLLPPAQQVAVDLATFWGRMDYLVGLRAGWTTCPSNGPRKSATRARSEFNPLCNALATDPAPPPPSGSP